MFMGQKVWLRPIERDDLHRVFLRVDANNPRGIRCHEKAGFRMEGTHREAVYGGGTDRDQH